MSFNPLSNSVECSRPEFVLEPGLKGRSQAPPRVTEEVHLLSCCRILEQKVREKPPPLPPFEPARNHTLGLVAPNRARAATQSSVQTRTILIGCHFKIKLGKLCIDVTSYTSRATSAAIFEQYFKSHFQAANKNFPHLHESLCCRSRAADATTPILQNSTPPGTCACNFASRLGASDLERDERSLPHDVMSASNQPPPPEEPN